MHYSIFKVFTLVTLPICLTTSLIAQDATSLIQLQQDFEDGKLTANETVRTQLLLLNNASKNTNGFLKCTTPISLMVHNHWDQLSKEVKSEYQKAFTEPELLATENYISPSGKFRVQYETTGINAVPSADANNNSVPDYVEWIAEAADSSYDRFIERGFTDIFNTKSMPFDIIVANDDNAYGFVPPNAPYIGIENDFVGFPSNTDPEGSQKGAVKVTIAHELKHVFQFVQKGWSGDPDRWLEMDATLYEEVMYDEVNDYYNYLDGFGNNFFGAPTVTIIPGSYEDITWALFFEERFGTTFWTKVWERIESQSPSISYFEAIESALSEFETTFEEAAIENFLWHFASGASNFTPFYGFDESSLYPNPRLQGSFEELQTELTDPQNMSRFSGRYFEFDLIQENNSLLKIDYIPGSSDIQVGFIVYHDDLSVETRFITNPKAAELNSNETGLSWQEIDRLGVVFFNSSSTQTQSIQFRVYDYVPAEIESPQLSQNYPNPFNPNTTIMVTLPFSQNVTLTVYDYLGRKVRVLADGVLGAGDTPIPFDANDLSSGIYFYRLETADKVVTRKMTFIK